MKNRILYISYDGMTDPLGQSQVLPYLTGLSARGWEITLISAEKPERAANTQLISEICKKANIDWQPVNYTKSPPLLSTIKDVRAIRKKAFDLHGQKEFKIVHCRSYISALVGLAMQRKLGIKFLFDMRGFWADERLDGGIWNIKNPLFKTVYNYFKRKEKEFLTKADYTVSLTYQGKKVIEEELCKNPSPIAVIPCCADTDHFSTENVNSAKSTELKSVLKINDDQKVLAYIGSLGTWYLLDEMLHFFKELSKKYPEFVFLFLTLDDPNLIYKKAETMKINLDKIRVTASSRIDLPTYMSFVDCSVFFIKPAFSKQASSPTKMGELMAMGIPIIANDGVGDSTQLIRKYNCGEVINLSNENSYNNAVLQLEKLLSLKKDKIREGALDFFSLSAGIDKYETIYKTLSNER